MRRPYAVAVGAARVLLARRPGDGSAEVLLVRRLEALVRLRVRAGGLLGALLKVAGRWRDHERWAITSEQWREAS